MELRTKIILAVLVSTIVTATTVYAVLTYEFPATLQVHVRNQFRLYGPSPGTLTILGGTSSQETLAITNNGQLTLVTVTYQSNSTDWTIGNTVRILTMTFNNSATVGVTGDPACGSAVNACSYPVTIPSGRSVIIATIAAAQNPTVENPTVNFFLNQ